jgi:hypothetical protein
MHTLARMSRTTAKSAKLLLAVAMLALSLFLGFAASSHGAQATLVCYQDPGHGRVCTRIP